MIGRIGILAVVLGIATQHTWSQESSNQHEAATPTASTPRPDADMRDELNEVRDLVRAQTQLLDRQRRQLERQQAEIDELRGRMGVPAAAQEDLATTGAAQLTEEVATMRTPATATGHVELAVLSRAVTPPQAPQQAPQQGGEQAERPLSIHFGKASLTPGGWADFTAIYRTRDVGSGLGTAFATIPYDNTVQGGLSETRFTSQNSRITLRADENFAGTRVFGYAEADFNGTLPGNAYVSTNSDSLRLRVFFADLAHGRWEVLGGQSWSMMTPNRVAISPFLSEIYNTLHLDSNYQVGLTYARQTQLRTVVRLSPTVEVALSAENPNQYSGAGATFPALFSTSETDTNSSSGSTGGATATPSLHPDLISKLAWDPRWLQRHWHLEASGLLTPVAILTPATITGTSPRKDIHEGGGLGLGANLEIAPNLHLIATGFWSDGGGRYIGGLGPGFVVEQKGGITSPFEAQLLHSGSGIAAAEWRATHNTIASLTFSSAYFGRQFSTDPSTGKLVGYGFLGSSNTNNRALEEGTFSTQTTLWRQPGYGAVQMITQSSYILRAPWYVAPGTPRDAHIFSGYANLRYVLP
ncbi:MAG TPA: hypothetical protein VGJ21_02880 [Terracidiphilus sp.]|jgi:hypothetical protein